MKHLFFFFSVFILTTSFAQTKTDSITFDPQKQLNAAQRLLSGNYASAVTVSVYSEATYNQPEGDNGELDIQRIVLLFGYRFDDRTQFITEVEIEHVNEVFVEQAFVNYAVGNSISLRGGLMLVPFGIINEYHEPTTYNGTERPAIDNVIVPTTWRELGIGVAGRFNSISLSYQAYLFNGFLSASPDGSGGVNGVLQGSNALRGGRQRGIQSTINTPTFSGKLDYYGISGLRLGLSGYFGDTQVDDEIDTIDGAIIGLSMAALDARYAYKRFTARGQYVYGSLSNTEAYNTLTGRDLGSQLQGWYLEGAFNVLPAINKQRLFAFVRYESYDTHADTAGTLERNPAFDRTDVTTGLSYHIAPGVVIKGDYQFRDNALDNANVQNRLNFGIGVWF